MNKKRFKSQLLMVFTVFAVCCLSFNSVLRVETTDTVNTTDTTKPFVASVSSSENAVGLEEEILVQVTNIGQLQDEAREKNKKIILGYQLRHLPRFQSFGKTRNGRYCRSKRE
jgi:hypothetical protein